MVPYRVNKKNLIKIYHILYFSLKKYTASIFKLLRVPVKTDSFIINSNLANNIDISYTLFGYSHFKGHYPAAEPQTWNWLAKNLIIPGTIIDVGANIGQFSIIANEILKKKFTTFDDEIIQIEPSDRNFELLTKNNEDNKVKCLALNIALGSKSEFKSIKIHEVYGRVSYKKQYHVKTLDTLSTDLNLAVVQLIKIDTDGHELSILQGGKEFFKKFKPNLIIEMNKKNAKESGVKLFDIENELYSMNYKLIEVLDSENFVFQFGG